jgi:hypothetical protein
MFTSYEYKPSTYITWMVIVRMTPPPAIIETVNAKHTTLEANFKSFVSCMPISRACREGLLVATKHLAIYVLII